MFLLDKVPQVTRECLDAELERSLRKLYEQTKRQEASNSVKEKYFLFSWARQTPVNSEIESKKEFNNPEMLQKVIDKLDIDEIGTNFDKRVLDPHGIAVDAGDFYDGISKKQLELL